MSRKNSEPRMNVWLKVSDVKRLRKHAVIDEESNASILSRVMDRIEEVGIDDQRK